MKIFDISQEVFSCAVYPGGPTPERQTLYSIGSGDLYNLTSFAMCAHNGTHIDAPFHFLHNGKTVDQMDLAHFVGACYVARHQVDVTAADAEEIRKKASGAERILIAGNATVTDEAAEVFAEGRIKLPGNEGQTVVPEDAPMRMEQFCFVNRSQKPLWDKNKKAPTFPSRPLCFLVPPSLSGGVSLSAFTHAA